MRHFGTIWLFCSVVTATVACRGAPAPTAKSPPAAAKPAASAADLPVVPTPAVAAAQNAGVILAEPPTAQNLATNSQKSGNQAPQILGLRDAGPVLQRLRTQLIKKLPQAKHTQWLELAGDGAAGSGQRQLDLQLSDVGGQVDVPALDVKFVFDDRGCHVRAGATEAVCSAEDSAHYGLLVALCAMATPQAWEKIPWEVESLRSTADGGAILRLANMALRLRIELRSDASNDLVAMSADRLSAHLMRAAPMVWNVVTSYGNWAWAAVDKPVLPDLRALRLRGEIGALSLDQVESKLRQIARDHQLLLSGPIELEFHVQAGGIALQAWRFTAVGPATLADLPAGVSLQTATPGRWLGQVAAPRDQVLKELALQAKSPGCYLAQVLGTAPQHPEHATVVLRSCQP